HGQALPRALGVPDDPALAPADTRLRCAHAKVLVVPAQLLDAGVEDDEVVDQLEEACLGAELRQLAVERVRQLGPGRSRREAICRRRVLLPAQVVLLGRLDGAVAQPLAVVARHHELDGREEDRKSTRLNSSHVKISYAVFCVKKKKHIKLEKPMQISKIVNT